MSSIKDTVGLRGAVAAVEIELDRLAQEHADEATATTRLRASWLNLIEQLALVPPPALRACPHCQHTVMRAATRCGYCWRKLEPLS